MAMPCKHPMCKNMATYRGYCDEHRTKTSKRLEHNSLYHTKQWRATREIFLASYPLCSRCKCYGLTTPATTVDHIRPHKGDLELFWDHSNYQSLCTSCHSFKTNQEIAGWIYDYSNGAERSYKINS